MENDINLSVDNNALAQALIDKWQDNPVIKDMITAEKYYRVENEKIETKKREYINDSGQTVENKFVSNSKLVNAFYRKAVNQKVNYAFGKPPVISVEAIEPDNEIKDENGENKDEKAYQKAWEDLLNPENRKEIQNLAHYAVNCGIGYVYLYMDENGFYINNVPSETIYPYWTDRKHRELNAILRNYKDTELKDGEFKEVGKAELWTKEDVSYYDNDGSLQLEKTEKHMQAGTEGKSWDRVPYIWLKGTTDELPLLRTVKSYVDEYDALNSQSVDTLKDDLDSTYIFENYDPTIGSLTKAYATLKETKVGAVDADGDIRILKNNPDISAIQTKLEHLKKDINEFSCTVDVQDIQFGSNPTGIAIKAAFQDTDIYINDIEMEFELFIQNLKYFYDLYLDWTGKVKKEVSSKYKVIATLDRDLMINESEILSDIVKLQGLVSQETLDDNNPYVESHAIEQARRDKEAEANAEEEDPFEFPPPKIPDEDVEVEPERETITRSETERIRA